MIKQLCNQTTKPKALNELALFAGAGGGVLGGHLLGWRTVCAVEWDAYAASVLVARQNDGCLPPFPIWDDVQTFDGRPWRGRVDVVSGGFPCQDISSAGRGSGIGGKRSSMWKHMARIIREVRPRYVFVENSPLLTSRGLNSVLGDLAQMGYDAKWGVLGAGEVGANHQRDRIWIVGDNKEQQVPDPDLSQLQGGSLSSRIQQKIPLARNVCWWETEPNVDRVADGLASRVDRLKVVGNGQVPLCAATAWNILTISPAE